MLIEKYRNRGAVSSRLTAAPGTRQTHMAFLRARPSLRPLGAWALLTLLPMALEAQRGGQRGGQRGAQRGGGRGGAVGAPAGRETEVPRGGGADAPPLMVLVGRPTDRSVTLNLLASEPMTVRIRYGASADAMSHQTPATRLTPGVPTEVAVAGLVPDRRYTYQVESYRGDRAPVLEAPATWHTQRAPGQPFTFTVQGDSHPERVGRMFDEALYRRTLAQVRDGAPDFHLMLGDDFSIERLISRGAVSGPAVDAVYAGQRRFLDVVSRHSVVVPVNGNHEEAARFLLDGTPTSAPVLAGLARNRFFSPPMPDGFYSGDSVPVPHLGLPRDYFAWTWGDALFVVIDPYWHTPPTDPGTVPRGGREGREGREAGGGNAMQAAGVGRDLWQMTLGDAQYAWLARTLRHSTARWKFVFAHHVLGTGRGGVELADVAEWGGRDRSGVDAFRRKRPSWPMPIHQLFVDTRVTVFFQGHDHLFARQEKDGVIYQSVPNPADPTYTAFNREAYRSGDILPNSGHLRVRVEPEGLQVDYIRAFLPSSPDGALDGRVAFTYRVR